MKKEDKEIEKLLSEYENKEIQIPIEFEDKLNNKLNQIKPRYNNNIKVASLIIIFIISSSMLIPDIRSFANDMFNNIFKDVGVDNAVESGYDLIDIKDVSINGYDISIDKVYIDKLRMGFDITTQNSDREIELRISSESLKEYGDEGYSMNHAILNEENKYTSKIQIEGKLIESIANNKYEKIELELELLDTLKENIVEVVGKEKIVLDINPKVYDSK